MLKVCGVITPSRAAHENVSAMTVSRQALMPCTSTRLSVNMKKVEV